MASNTFTLIASSTVGSGGAANMTFSSIPSTYTDLKISLTGRIDSTSGNGLNISFNGTTTGYTNIAVQGNGGTASSFGTYNRNSGQLNISSDTASTFSNNDIYIPNYAGSTNKSYSVDAVEETNATAAYMSLIAGLWSNTAAITSISFAPMSGNFVQYSTAYLYGVKNA